MAEIHTMPRLSLINLQTKAAITSLNHFLKCISAVVLMNTRFTTECVISRGNISRRQNGLIKTQFRETQTKRKGGGTTQSPIQLIRNQTTSKKYYVLILLSLVCYEQICSIFCIWSLIQKSKSTYIFVVQYSLAYINIHTYIHNTYIYYYLEVLFCCFLPVSLCCSGCPGIPCRQGCPQIYKDLPSSACQALGNQRCATPPLGISGSFSGGSAILGQGN